MQPSGPAQPPYQPLTPQGPMPYGPPPRRMRLSPARLAVIAVILVAAVVGAAYYLVAIAPQPRIVLTDSTYTTTGCGAFGPNHFTYTWTFTLINTGDADGFGTVKFYVVQGVEVAENVYFIPQHSQITRGGSVNSPDCAMTYYPYLNLVGVTKA